jgi:hypothetical protein
LRAKSITDNVIYGSPVSSFLKTSAPFRFAPLEMSNQTDLRVENLDVIDREIVSDDESARLRDRTTSTSTANLHRHFDFATLLGHRTTFNLNFQPSRIKSSKTFSKYLTTMNALARTASAAVPRYVTLKSFSLLMMYHKPLPFHPVVLLVTAS